ncbi:MAG: LrgB family protein [Bacteroidaceae bacterium]|nr:LrgB family protein [Bacteroidaceae bacterium]
MIEALGSSLFLGIGLTLGGFLLGSFLKNRYKIFIFNPLLVSITVCIATLLLLDIDYNSYNKGASHISMLLTPATVCLAIPLYEQLQLLKRNATAILVGIASGVITSAAAILLMSLLFGLSHTQYVTLLPKSITTAIGIGLSAELHGYIAITVAAIIITGLTGNIIGDKLCNIFGIKHPVAKGIAIGTSAHVMGTSKAMELGEVEGAMSSLSVAVAGLMTVAAALIFENFI